MSQHFGTKIARARATATEPGVSGQSGPAQLGQEARQQAQVATITKSASAIFTTDCPASRNSAISTRNATRPATVRTPRIQCHGSGIAHRAAAIEGDDQFAARVAETPLKQTSTRPPRPAAAQAARGTQPPPAASRRRTERGTTAGHTDRGPACRPPDQPGWLPSRGASVTWRHFTRNACGGIDQRTTSERRKDREVATTAEADKVHARGRVLEPSG